MIARFFSLISACRRLIWHQPKDFLFSVLFTPFDPIAIEPYNPQAARAGRRLQARLKKITGLPVHFFGSVALGIPGRGDLDISVVCPSGRFAQIESLLTGFFGPPAHTQPQLTKWEITYSRLPVDLNLVEAKSREFKGQLEIFSLLRTHPHILKQYAALKYTFNHLTHWEYEIRRKDFFNRILGRYP